MILLLLCAAIAFADGACSMDRPAADQNASAGNASSRHLRDGKDWTTENLRVESGESYCYDNADVNCRRYGRLYTWESAQRGCAALGSGWRLPTDGEWRRLASAYGGVSQDSDDGGKAAYDALISGGSSGFEALLGGNRDADSGRFDRVDAHGFYWTASEANRDSAPFYNFAQGGLALHRQSDGNKQMAASARCVRE